MGRLPSDACSAPAKLLARRACGPDAFILEVELDQPLAKLNPGRFAMLAPLEPNELTVPRPFSVYQQLYATRLSFLIQVLGKGTQVLREIPLGDSLLCTAPLGNGFTVADDQREVVLVGGGIGSAPFLMYLQQRASNNTAVTHFIYGARSLERLYDHQTFAMKGVNVLHATDDGSSGFHGNVVAALEQEIESGRISKDALFCVCGPGPMLKGFDEFARGRELEFQLSLETYMGCGIGVCNGCPTKTSKHGQYADWPWAKTCLDGPVFKAYDISALS